MKLVAGIAIAIATLGAAAVYFGVYDVSATDEHLRPTYWLLRVGMLRSVAVRARKVEVPPLGAEAQVRRGLGLYREHCLRCHGAPGVAPEPFALGMTPVPENLVYAARTWQPAEIFWAAKNGIKMTGMPAWQYRLTEEELWAIVAFVMRLPGLSPTQYRALRSPRVPPAAQAVPPAPDLERGKKAIHQYGCVTCHSVPGVVGSHAPVGPPLDRIASRSFIAGVLVNTSVNMARWLQSPQAVKPGTAMPDLAVSARDAKDMAAYLETLN